MTMMTRRRDFVFVSAIGLIAAVPLVLLRNWVLPGNSAVLLAIGGLELLLCVLWLVSSRHVEATARGSAPLHRNRAGFWKTLLISGSLLVLTILAVYIPARKNFWVGQDEVYNLAAEASPWHQVYEDIAGRPFSAMLGFVVLQIIPGRLEGLFWLATALRLLTGLCLSGIVRMLLPRSPGIPLIAAMLFIVNPSEPMRFAVVAIFPYYEMLFLLGLAVWLVLVSYHHQRRWLLLIACFVLITALLHYEGAFTLAILAPILLRIRGRSRHLALWSFAWIGAMALCALRYVSFLTSSRVVYQVTYLTTVTRTLAGLLDNLKTLLLPFFSFFTGITSRAVETYGVLGAITAALAALILFLAVKKGDSLSEGRSYVRGAAWAGLALLMSIALFVPVLPRLADAQEHASTRYEFLASLPQAIAWALIIGLVGSLLAARLQRLAMIAVTGGMVMLAVIGAYDFQDHTTILSASLDTRYVDFNRISRIFQQAHQLMPPISADTAIFFQIKDDQVSPFGWDYHLFNLSCLMFGAPGYVGRYSPESGWLVRIKSNLVRSGNPEAGLPTSAENTRIYEFARVVLFEVTPDGHVALLDTPDPGKRYNTAPGKVYSTEPCLVGKLRSSRQGFPLPYLAAN